MNTQPVRTDLIHVSDAAEIAGVSSSAIYQHGRSGRLNSTLIDGFRMFYRAEVVEYAAARSKSPSGMLTPNIKFLPHGMQSLGEKMPPEILLESVQSVPDTLNEVKDLATEFTEFSPVLTFLVDRVREINERLAVFSAEIAELEAKSNQLISQQEDCQIALASLERIEKGIATQ